MTTNSEFLFSGGGGAAEYQIQRSVRFNSADSAYLSRTPSVAGNRKTWTWSGWVKRSGLGAAQVLFLSDGGTSDSTFGHISFSSNDTLIVNARFISWRNTSAVFKDVSAWYHIVVGFDTTQLIPSDRVKVFVNGTQVTQFATTVNPSLNTDYAINQIAAHSIARGYQSYSDFSGYLADIHFIDGQALDPTSFGEFDTNGVWQPKAYSGTYGTNGFHLPFSDNSTAAALGTDTSGNGNDWTTNNLSVAAGAGNDSLVDTPTNYGTDTGVGGEVRGNYATLNPLDSVNASFAEGNLSTTITGGAQSLVNGTFGFTSGKWYWEAVVTASTDSSPMIGIVNLDQPVGSRTWQSSGGWYYFMPNGSKYNSGAGTGYGNSYSINDVIGVALDMDSGTVAFYKNGVSPGVAFSSGLIGKTISPALNNGSGAGVHTVSFNFGQRPFAYAAPTGYKALCTQNLPDPTIADGSTAMDVALWTGDGVNNRQITGLNFSPDLVWIKSRSQAYDALISDAVRGSNLSLIPSSTSSETTNNVNGYVSALSSSGFTLTQGTSSIVSVNGSTTTYAAWTWDAGSSTVTNTDGSITSQVRANPSAGFSITTLTTPASGNFTAGHGLGVSPELVICKARNTTGSWITYHKSAGAGFYLDLNTIAAATPNSAVWQNTDPSSTVVYGSSSAWGTADYVMYCFAPVEGYSAFGSYTGNGSADGNFVYTGFRPRWLMIKDTTGSSNYWWIFDTARDTYNASGNYLFANVSDSEQDYRSVYPIDILSNGFKVRNTLVSTNSSVFIYAAFAENPFKTARAR